MATQPGRKGHQNRGDVRNQSVEESSAGGEDSSRVPGRLRRYLDRSNGRDFDVSESADTPESRLVDPDHPSWHVPAGNEPHMRRRPGRSVRDVRMRDVGRFKLSDFSTRASDERGHSRSLKIHMPEQMINELTAIVDARIYPTRNVEALARTLICEGLDLLHRIAQQDGLLIPNSHMQQIEAQAIINRNAESVLAYDEVMDRACELIRNLQRRGARARARTMVFETIANAEKIPSRELRDRWLREIRSEFAALMRGRPAQVHAPRRRATDVQDEDNED